jgi:hypothetical protein
VAFNVGRANFKSAISFCRDNYLNHPRDSAFAV